VDYTGTGSFNLYSSRRALDLDGGSEARVTNAETVFYSPGNWTEVVLP
jgi:hypothetical protein